MTESYSVADAGVAEHGVKFARDWWELDGPKWFSWRIVSASK